MNSKHHKINDQELLTLISLAAKDEKKAMLVLLEYLLEVDIRRLYALKHYSTLFEFTVKELGYSEPAAAERVNAVRLMRSVPEVKNHISEGKLTLTSAAQIQRFIKTEEKVNHAIFAEHQKSELINLCLSQSKREVETTLLKRQSEAARTLTQEKMRAITPERTELKLTLGHSSIKRIERIKELTGDSSLESIFDQALELLVMKEEKKRGMDMKPKKEELSQSEHLQNPTVSKMAQEMNSIQTATQHNLSIQFSKNFKPSQIPHPAKSNQPAESPFFYSSNSRFIPIEIKRAVFRRSHGCCEFVDSITLKRCESRFRLQFDHIFPLPQGGKTELKNLGHLCTNHNLRAAKAMGLIR